MNQNIRWEDVVKKEAIGIDKCDLGKVQQIKDDTIITEKGVINKKNRIRLLCKGNTVNIIEQQ